MLVNVTLQTFQSENELELSIARWDQIKDKFMPRFGEFGLMRYTISRIWNKNNNLQLAHIFEYTDKEAMQNCIPIWQEIETQFKDKIPSITVAHRGVLVDQYSYEQ